MGVQKELFGSTKDGKEVYIYTLTNSRGMKARVMSYGAILVDLIVPDKNGHSADVVLGYDKLSDYFVNGCFFGSPMQNSPWTAWNIIWTPMTA